MILFYFTKSLQLEEVKLTAFVFHKNGFRLKHLHVGLSTWTQWLTLAALCKFPKNKGPS